MKEKNLKIDFFPWIQSKWAENGGLITQATATLILNKSKGRINQMITEGKLKEYRYKNMSFVSYAEVIKMAKYIAYNKAKKEIKEQIKKLKEEKKIPKEMVQQMEDESLKSIREGMFIEEDYDFQNTEI